MINYRNYLHVSREHIWPFIPLKVSWMEVENRVVKIAL
jgi:hypothetical protein